MSEEKLDKKQRAFVEAYLANGFNGTQAALKAGYGKTRSSIASLADIASENLRKPHIRELVDQRLRSMAMQADEVLARLSMFAEGLDPLMFYKTKTLTETKEYINKNGKKGKVTSERIVLVPDLDAMQKAGKGHMVRRINNNTNPPSLEFYDPQVSLVTLAKGHGLLIDKVESKSLVAHVILREDRGDITARRTGD